MKVEWKQLRKYHTWFNSNNKKYWLKHQKRQNKLTILTCVTKVVILLQIFIAHEEKERNKFCSNQQKFCSSHVTKHLLLHSCQTFISIFWQSKARTCNLQTQQFDNWQNFQNLRPRKEVKKILNCCHF